MQLLDSITVGGRTVRNRTLFGPHVTNLGVGRSISDRHVAYYARRAASAGLIVVEDASVHESDWPYERAPLAAEAVDGWRDVGEACRPHGALVLAGLGHAGLQGSSAFHQRELWAPSRVPDATTRELPKEMEADDIDAVLTGYAQAARLAGDANLDGVEVNAGQHSLVRQFLSGLTNMRGDEWGPGEDGSGRIRFITEVLQRVRAELADDAVLGLRLSCDELAPWAGLTPEMAAPVAAQLASLVDYLVVVRGSIFSTDATRPDAHVDAGFNADLVNSITHAVEGQTVVVAQGSITDHGQAEWLLTDGRADMVELTRAHIAEPDYMTKLASDPATIRPCIRCNQRCNVRDNRNPIVSCVANPTAGYEHAEPEVVPASRASDATDVLIVGAGPAGLECARMLATAGHRVTVADQADETATTVRHWTVASGRSPLVAIVDWLETECRRLGVTITLGTAVTIADVAAWEADGATVVFCTGSEPGPRLFDVAEGAAVIRPLELLAGLRAVGPNYPDGPVVVWDPVGGPIAISVAETIAATAAETQREITFVTPDVNAGTLLALSGDLAAASTRLHQANVSIVCRHVVRTVTADGVEIEDRFTGDRRVLPAAFVVDGSTDLPNDQLWREAGARHDRAGDAVAPRTMYEAILEGRRVANGVASKPVLQVTRG